MSTLRSGVPLLEGSVIWRSLKRVTVGLVSGGLAFALCQTIASAQTVVSARARTSQMSPAQLQQILQIAKPMEKQLLKRPSILSQSRLAAFGPPSATPVVVAGDKGPADQVGSTEAPQSDGISPQNYGSGNLNTVYHYNDYLVEPILMKRYPYRAAGYFIFKQNGSWYYCSASLISRSILLVAGHCVHSGNNSSSGWDTEGYFYPAATGLNGGTPVTPYGYASAYSFSTWTAWYQTGALDQGYDVGLVVLNNSSVTAAEIGLRTGWFGFCTANCLQAYWFISQLGYPSNYYGGNNMTESQHLNVSDSRDFVWGTGMRFGSSGGPHVANIGYLSDSATDQGQWPYRNIVFAPTSWGYNSESLKIEGGSALSGPNNTFVVKNLYNPTCQTARALHGARSCILLR